MLPLPVSYNCSQQQRDDSHEVKVPLRSQKLVHIKLGEHIPNLNENIKIIMITNMSEKELGKLCHKLGINTEPIKIIGFRNILQCVSFLKKGFKRL